MDRLIDKDMSIDLYHAKCFRIVCVEYFLEEI